MAILNEENPAYSSVLLCAVCAVCIGLVLMAYTPYLSFYVGALISLGGLIHAKGGLKGLFPTFRHLNWDAAAWMVFSSLAYVIVTGAILNAFGQRTFSDGFFTNHITAAFFSAIGLQAASVVLWLFFHRYLPQGIAIILSAVLLGLYQGVVVGWDIPRLFFVFVPIEAIFAYGYVRTKCFAVVLAARITVTVSVIVMQAVPYNY